MRKIISSLAAAAVLAPAAAFADAPSADHVKQVWDFFEKGKGQGLVLGDLKVCTDVAKTGDNKAECTAEIPEGGSVKAGTTVYLWEAFLVPKGDEIGDVTVQVKQGDTVRETKDVSALKGEYWRTRTWQGFKLGKAGSWTFNVMRGDKTLKSVTVKAE